MRWAAPPSSRLRPVVALLALMSGGLLTGAVLSGCAPALQSVAQEAPYTGPLTPRPPGSPDVLIIAVSGRCALVCAAPLGNAEYLVGRGTVGVLRRVLEAQGLSVESYAVSDNLTTHTLSAPSTQPGASREAVQPGFLQAEARFVEADRDWVRGRSNPTRIVLVGHSHGVVWTHTLARLHPQVPVSVMVDLDGVCDLWESDHQRSLGEYLRGTPKPSWGQNIARACGTTVVDRRRYDQKDVVPDNVDIDLEVQSLHFLGRSQTNLPIFGNIPASVTASSAPPPTALAANYPFDALPNIRPNGSRRGIETYVAQTQTHSSVTDPGGRALIWVTTRLAQIAEGWKHEPGDSGRGQDQQGS